jgi:hypothetical protein
MLKGLARIESEYLDAMSLWFDWLTLTTLASDGCISDRIAAIMGARSRAKA